MCNSPYPTPGINEADWGNIKMCVEICIQYKCANLFAEWMNVPLTLDVSQVVFPCNEVADESARHFAGDIAWTTGILR